MSNFSPPPNRRDRSAPRRSRDRFFQGWWHKAKQPSTIVIGSIAIAVGIAGYMGIRFLVTEKLPPFLERQLSNVINHPVDLGEVKSFSLTGITFGESTIAKTPTDPDRAEIDRIRVGFNLLPVIFTRTLPLEITLVNPDVYLQQNQDGSWLNLNLGSGDGNQLPIDFKITTLIDNGELAVLPNQAQSPIQIQLDGSVTYNQTEGQPLEYDLDTEIGQAVSPRARRRAIANIEGQTVIETGKTNAEVLIEDLALTKVFPLLPNVPLDLTSGRLNADLDVNIPSFEQINDTRIQGDLSLTRFQAETEQLSQPLNARSRLRFRGERVEIDRTQASINDIVARIDGRLNWEKGYDVSIKVPSFSLSNLLEIIPAQSPIPVAGSIQADFQLTGAIKEPLLTGTISNTKPVRLAQTQIQTFNTQLEASLERVVLEQLNIVPAAGGKITGNGILETNLDRVLAENTESVTMPLEFEFEAQLPAEELLQPYYENTLPVNVGIINATATVDGTLAEPQILLNWQAPSVQTTAQADISGSGEVFLQNEQLNIRNTQLQIDEGEIALRGTGNLQTNQWQTSVTANSVPLNPFLAAFQSEQFNLTQPITLDNGTVSLSGTFTPQTLDTLNGIANLNLTAGRGNVSVDGELDSGNLNLLANATAVPLDDFLTQIELEDPLNAQLDLSGDLNSFLQGSATIEANTVSIQLGEQLLDAEGNFTVANLANNLDLTDVQLDITASSNLNELPNQLLAQILANNQLIADNFDLAGEANFQGSLSGQNLLDQPLAPGNLNLIGDLQLQDFSVGQVAFETVLSGPVNLISGQEISFNLQGQTDVIAALLEPCTRGEQCRLPYLPTTIQLRQGEETAEPIIVDANREGEVLLVNLLNFPLSLLNLTPAVSVGIPGELQGEATGEAEVNLFTLATVGQVQVLQPAIGYINAEELVAEFAYDSDRNLAQLAAASLEFGNSIYQLNGTLNLNTQEIQGRLDIPQAYIQDLIAAFGWYDVQSLIALFQPPDLADGTVLEPYSVGEANATIAYLLRVLLIVQQRLQQLAAESDDLLSLPLALEGAYTGEVAIAGTLNSPNLSWQVVGNNWQWDTQRRARVVVESGNQREEIIPIDTLQIEGNYNNGAIALNTFLLELGQAVIALRGRINPEQTVAANFDLQNVSVDLIRNFVTIPLDVTGNFDLAGQVAGTLSNPQVTGDFAIEQATLNDRPLPPEILGEYQYANSRLNLNTTEPSSLQLQASIPYPTQPGNDRVSLTADLDTGAIAIIDALTGGQISFVGGNGEITLDASGRLVLDRDFPLRNLEATGEIALQNTTFQTTAFSEPLTVTAEIGIDQGLLQVRQLTGIFAQSNVSASGVLPLFEPRTNLNNPLTLQIEDEQIDLDQLYEGGVDATVIITGDALNPLIGGQVNLQDGQVFLPEDETETEGETEATTTVNLPEQENDSQQSESNFIPRFEDLQIVLEDFRFQQQPLYNFLLDGTLTLNGIANNLEQVQADGTLEVTRADVDVLSTEFNLLRSYDNIIVFDPETTILNPYVDVQLQTQVAELSDALLRSADSNEIPDPISQVGRSETINVILTVDGQANEIIPRLGQDTAGICRIEPPLEPLFEENIYQPEELQQLAECINTNAFEEGSTRELLNSPAVELSSNPPRSQGELISLLGNQFLGLAEQLQNSNEEQLFEFGVTQFLLTPLQRDIFYFAEETVNDLGETIGLDYLRVYPVFEGTYNLSEDSSASLTYDYFFGEVKVRYQLQF